MSMEQTDLERRVLAHERILQALIAHIAEDQPKFLDRLRAVFMHTHTLGANEHDYVDTDQYARQFVRQVEILQEEKNLTLVPRPTA